MRQKINTLLSFIKKNKEIIIAALVIFWSIFLFYKWIIGYIPILKATFGLQYGYYGFINSLEPLLLPLLILILFISCLYLFNRKTIINVKYSWLLNTLYFSIFIIIVFNITAFLKVTIPDMERLANPEHWLIYNFEFIKKSLALMSWIMLFSLSIYLLGKIIFRKIKIKLDDRDPLLINLLIFAMGIGGWSAILFVLGYFNIFSKISFISIFAILLIWEYKTIIKILKKYTEIKSTTINFKSLTTVLICINIFIFTIAFIGTQRNSLGFDSGTEYLNRAHLISEYGSLVTGTNPFVFSLFAAVGYVFSKSTMFSIGNSLVYVLLGYLSIYKLSSYFTKKNEIQLLIATTWIITPMNIEFLAFDVKVESLLFFISTMATIVFLRWIRNQKNTYLYLTALFLGIAFAIKITTLILVLTFFLYYVTKIIYSKDKIIKIKSGFVAMVIFMIPLIPWIFLALNTQSYKHIDSYRDILSNYNEKAPHVDKDIYQSLGINKDLCVYSGYVEDIGRFKYITGHGELFDKLSTIWTTFINPNKNGPLEIGFVYLLFIPLFFMLLLRKIRAKDDYSEIISITILSIIYWIIWLFTASYMIWYGISIFAFLSIIVAVVFENIKKFNILKKFLISIVIIQALIFTSRYTAIYIDRSVLTWITTNESWREIFAQSIKEKIAGNEIILSTASIMIYHIDKNDQRVLKDHYLDIFSCLDYEKDDKKTLARLKSLNIKFILYNAILKTYPYESIVNKTDRLEVFVKNNLNLVFNKNNILIFEIPQESK